MMIASGSATSYKATSSIPPSKADGNMMRSGHVPSVQLAKLPLLGAVATAQGHKGDAVVGRLNHL
jgi:hypothetical protein